MKSLVTTLTERGQASLPASLRKELGLKPGHRLRWQKLSSCEVRLLVEPGEDGRPFVAYRCATKAAERLGVPLVEFPGDHAAPLVATPQFVEKLRAARARA